MKKDPKNLIWGYYIWHTFNMHPRSGVYTKQVYDEEVWEWYMEELPKNGINTLIFNAMDNIVYSSHPEIALEDAWSHERLKKELDRFKERGIKVIPELNFSSFHSYWLKEYRRMTSSKVYYQVVKDLLEEAYELFEHPDYISISMDEEFYRPESVEGPNNKEDIAIIRKSDLILHDIRYMVDIIKGLGSMPIVAYDCLRMYTEKFKAAFSRDDLVLLPWHYLAFKPEHFMEDPYHPGVVFERDTPWVQRDFKGLEEVVKSEYNLIFLTGCWNEYPQKYSHQDAMEYMLENVSEDRILGFGSTSWMPETLEYMHAHKRDMKQYSEAKKKVFGI